MNELGEFTVSGDLGRYYVNDRDGRIIATYEDSAQAIRCAADQNERSIGDCPCGKPMMWSYFHGRYRHTDGTRGCSDAD